MKTTWLVQTNVTPVSPTVSQLRRTCQSENLTLIEFSHPPGLQCKPDIPIMHSKGPIVFHARSSALLGALGTVWSSGVFFSPERFCHEAYVAHYGSAYLNNEASLMSWHELLKHSEKRDEYLFIKPVDDYKGFTGQALSAHSLPGFFAQLSQRDTRITPSTTIVVSPAMEVDAEWRLFVVGNEVVGASMYRPIGAANAPKDVVDFARGIARDWGPAEVYVLDIGRVDGQLRVVECNCFNASRFYCANVRDIVKAVSDYQEQCWIGRKAPYQTMQV